jgi:hypothetical protein
MLASVTVYISIYAGSVSAATNSTINFQARVLTNTGAQVADGFYTVEFKVYDTVGGPTSQWSETQVITSKNGYITANLGSVNPFGTSVDWSQEQWLSMNINSDGEMAPRMKITAVPYSFRSGQADTLTDGSGTISASNLAQLAPGLVQSVTSANTALRINQTGAGDLLQLQSSGTDVLTVSNAGELQIAQGLTVGNSSSTTAGTIRWTGTDFEGYDGSGWISLSSGGGGSNANQTTIVKTANETVASSTAFQNDDELFFPIGANENWSFRFVLQANAPATPDIKFTITAPGGAICSFGVQDAEGAVTVGNLGCGVTSGVITGNGVADVYEVLGSIRNGGTAGNVTLQWAQNTSNATASTVFAGSYVVATSTTSGGGSEFLQGGNDFGATAVLGTTNNNNLNLITNGLTRLSVSSSGDVSVTNALTVGNGLSVATGGISVIGNSTIDGNLSGLTGITLASGTIDINAGGISNAGDITGVGNAISASGGLTIRSGAGNSLQLDSGNDILVLNDSTLRRVGVGTTSLELNDTSDTLLSLLNNDGGASANLLVEGSITADTFTGNGASITDLNASNLSTGTISDSLLSTNVALLNTAQSFSGLQTFTNGLIVGNTASATSGAIRWTGLDFEGYNGTDWVSLTGGGSGGPLSTLAIQAYDNTGGTDINNATASAIPWDSETKKDTGFTHSNVTNNSRVYLDEPGWYKVTYQVTGEDQGAGRVNPQCSVRLNGTTTLSQSVSYSYGRNTTDAFTTNSASTFVETTATNEYYEIICQQAGTAGAHLAVAGQSWTIAEVTAPPSGGSSSAYEQGGNSFGSTALLGTTDSNGLDLLTAGFTRISISSSGDTTISGLTTINGNLVTNATTSLNGDIILGDASTDTITLQSDNISLPNGLEIDSGTLTIDSAANTIGINTVNATNTLTVNTAATADAAAEVLIYTNGINQKGLVLQTTNGQIANAFEVQADNGTVLVAISDSGTLTLGSDVSGSSSAGILELNDSTNANGFTSVLGATSLTATRNILLPDEDGTICIAGSAACGFISFAPSSAQVDTSTNSSIFVNKTGASGDILTLQKNGSSVLRLLNSGALQLSVTDATAFLVEDSSGNDTFTVDTASGLVRIGSPTADATATLLVLDTKNTAGDPAGTDGAQYYNSDSQSFRCYENGAWKDCISKPTSQYTITGTSVTFTNQPAADTEFTGTPRILADLSDVSEFRVVISRPAGTVSVGANCRIQYSITEGVSWTNLNGGAGPAVDFSGAGGTKTSAWTAIAPGAQTDVYLRIVCAGGNGANDPQFRGVHIQVRN